MVTVPVAGRLTTKDGHCSRIDGPWSVGLSQPQAVTVADRPPTTRLATMATVACESRCPVGPTTHTSIIARAAASVYRHGSTDMGGSRKSFSCNQKRPIDGLAPEFELISSLAKRRTPVRSAREVRHAALASGRWACSPHWT